MQWRALSRESDPVGGMASQQVMEQGMMQVGGEDARLLQDVVGAPPPVEMISSRRKLSGMKPHPQTLIGTGRRK